jgi:AcrR family transcriptional regulator
MRDGSGPVPREPAVGQMQRERILDAVIQVVAERGIAETSVGLVIARAGVSRRAFYEHFAGLDECLIAVLNGALERAAPIVARAFDDSTPTRPWYDGMRAALAAMFELFEAEPELTYVCLVETLAGGPAARGHRERVMAAFRALVVARIEPEISHASALVPEGAMASVLGIVQARLAAREPQPLLELLGPLMGMIVGPFLDDAGVARQIEQGEQLARELLAGRSVAGEPQATPRAAPVGVEVPDVLLAPRAHRVRQCLLYVAENPGASNRRVGAALGIPHSGQIAGLLGRLAGLGLLVKHAGKPGHPNAWSPTTAGRRVAAALAERR